MGFAKSSTHPTHLRIIFRLGRLVGAAATAAAPTAKHPLSAGLLQLGLPQRCADLPGGSHDAADGLILRVFIEEQHDLAGRTLTRIAVLKPAGAFAEYAPATPASDLNGIVEHPAIL